MGKTYSLEFLHGKTSSCEAADSKVIGSTLCFPTDQVFPSACRIASLCTVGPWLNYAAFHHPSEQIMFEKHDFLI